MMAEVDDGRERRVMNWSSIILMLAFSMTTMEVFNVEQPLPPEPTFMGYPRDQKKLVVALLIMIALILLNLILFLWLLLDDEFW